MKKKLRIASLTLAMLTIFNLTACESNEAENTTVPTEYITEIVIDEEGNTQINTYPTTQSVANAKGQIQVSTIATQNSDSKVSQNVSKTVAGNSTKTTTAKKSSQSSSSKQQKTTTKTTVKTTAKTTVKYAGKGDERAVAQAVIKWINYYRVQEGKKAAIEMLGKATQYAVGRSKQLVTNFAHDWEDEKKVLNSMKYGRFVDSYEWNGKTIEGYYQCDLSSAIAEVRYSHNFDTADEIGKSTARLAKGSKGHWSYVGDADGDGYNYIAVGVTLDGGFAYVDIEMATENIDNTGYYDR